MKLKRIRGGNAENEEVRPLEPPMVENHDDNCMLLIVNVNRHRYLVHS